MNCGAGPLCAFINVAMLGCYELVVRWLLEEVVRVLYSNLAKALDGTSDGSFVVCGKDGGSVGSWLAYRDNSIFFLFYLEQPTFLQLFF